MKLLLSLSAVALAGLVGCKSIPVAENAADIGVSFDFEARHACKVYRGAMSRLSPEVKLTNVPEGTAFLEFKMVDLDYLPFNHGSETLEYTGNVIPEGGLKSYYGPCPPNSHRYTMTFKALNADKSLILGEGKGMARWPK